MQERFDQMSGGCNLQERESVDKAHHGTEGMLYLSYEDVTIYYVTKVDKIVWYCLHNVVVTIPR